MRQAARGARVWEVEGRPRPGPPCLRRCHATRQQGTPHAGGCATDFHSLQRPAATTSQTLVPHAAGQRDERPPSSPPPINRPPSPPISCVWEEDRRLFCRAATPPRCALNDLQRHRRAGLPGGRGLTPTDITPPPHVAPPPQTNLHSARRAVLRASLTTGCGTKKPPSARRGARGSPNK